MHVFFKTVKSVLLMHWKLNIKFNGTPLNNLRFTDDIVIITDNFEEWEQNIGNVIVPTLLVHGMLKKT